MGSPVLLQFSLCTCRRHYPGEVAWVPVVLFPSNGSFPCDTARSAFTSLFSRPAQRSLALQPAHSRSRFNDPFHRRLQTGRCLPACSNCYRPERPLPGGTCTLSRTVPFHGTRRQNHTASPSATGALVSRAVTATASRLTFMTIAIRPSCRGGIPRINHIFLKNGSKYFCWRPGQTRSH